MFCPLRGASPEVDVLFFKVMDPSTLFVGRASEMVGKVTKRSDFTFSLSLAFGLSIDCEARRQIGGAMKRVGSVRCRPRLWFYFETDRQTDIRGERARPRVRRQASRTKKIFVVGVYLVRDLRSSCKAMCAVIFKILRKRRI